MTLDSRVIRFMRVFAVILKIYVNFPDFMPAPNIRGKVIQRGVENQLHCLLGSEKRGQQLDLVIKNVF